MTTNNGLLDTLKNVWGYETFRPLQEKAITALLNRQDLIALFATGGGKSLIYQLPAVYTKSKAVVISPLIALIEDQIEQLKSLDIKAKALHSQLNYYEQTNAMDDFVFGETQFLYIAPERLKNDDFIERLKSANVSYFAIDEAHCISQWGHDFRPAFLNLKIIREKFPNKPIVALTATANKKILKEIEGILMLKEPKVYANSFFRSNLKLQLSNPQNTYNQVIEDITEFGSDQSVIVYRRSRKGVEELFEHLRNNGINVCMYHAGLEVEKRHNSQEEWLRGKAQVIVATNAFGMGIDKDDVRLVVHFDLPNSPEEYIQEIGRAGRDGRNSYCILYYDRYRSTSKLKLIQNSKPQYDRSRKLYGHLCNYLQLPLNTFPEAPMGIDIEQFLHNYRINKLDFHQDLKLLERDGYLKLVKTKASDVAGLCILKPNDEGLESLDQIVTYFNRTNPEVFRGLQYINIRKLAFQLNMELSALKEILLELKQQGSILYDDDSQPFKIIFLKERMLARNLQFRHSYWNLQHKLKVSRFEYIRNVFESTECYMRQLLLYFDEVHEDCQNCSNCLTISKAAQLNLKEIIPSILKEGPLIYKDLKSKVRDMNFSEDEMKKVLREMLKEELVCFTSDSHFALRQKNELDG